MFSKKTRYAILAVTALAREYGKGPIPISRLAEEEGIPRRFLESILLQLKNIGLLKSTRGKDGGYFLAKAPSEISIRTIIEECESAEFMPCINGKLHPTCSFDRDMDKCSLRAILINVYSSAANILDEATFADLVK